MNNFKTNVNNTMKTKMNNAMNYLFYIWEYTCARYKLFQVSIQQVSTVRFVLFSLSNNTSVLL